MPSSSIQGLACSSADQVAAAFVPTGVALGRGRSIQSVARLVAEQQRGR